MNAIEKRAREILDATPASPTPEHDFERNVVWEKDVIAALITALTPPDGHVVVTRNDAGQAVAVTRQDDKGRILSVIAEFEHEPGVSVATLRALSDRWASDRSYTGSPVDDIRALIDEPSGAPTEVNP